MSNQNDSSKKSPMTPADAARIQSSADRKGTNQDFKARAQSAGDKNANADKIGGQKK